MFPILQDPVLSAVPWSILAPHEAQAQRNHSQTLRTLANRGGLSSCEALAIIEDRSWRKEHQAYARAKVLTYVWQAEKAAIIAQQETNNASA